MLNPMRAYGEAQKGREFYRMLHWAAIAAALYYLATTSYLDLAQTYPGIQGAIFHYANLVGRGFVGYWLARAVAGRLDDKPSSDLVGPSVVYAARLLTRGLVLAGVVMTSR